LTDVAVVCLTTKLHIKNRVLQLTQPVNHPTTGAAAVSNTASLLAT
jgi:hypothetical protein